MFDLCGDLTSLVLSVLAITVSTVSLCIVYTGCTGGKSTKESEGYLEKLKKEKEKDVVYLEKLKKETEAMKKEAEEEEEIRKLSRELTMRRLRKSLAQE